MCFTLLQGCEQSAVRKVWTSSFEFLWQQLRDSLCRRVEVKRTSLTSLVVRRCEMLHKCVFVFCTCCLHFTTVWWYFVVTDASSSWRNDRFPIQCPALVESIKHLDVLGVAHHCVREHPTTLPPTPRRSFYHSSLSSCACAFIIILGLKVHTTQHHTQPCNTHTVCICSSCKSTLKDVAVSIMDCCEGAKCYTAWVLLMRV